MLQVRRSAVHGLAVVGLLMLGAGAVWIAAGEWPGTAAGCLMAGTCDCEAVGIGPLRQPVTALSSAGLVLVGLAVLARSDAYRQRRVDLVSELRVLGAAILLAGFGSTALHTTVTAWGAWLDGVGVDAVLLAVLTVEAGRMRGRPVSIAVWSGAVGVDGLLRAVLDTASGRVLTALLVVAVVAGQIVIMRSDRRRDNRLLWWAGGAVTGGFLIRALAADAAWCRPESLLQGHAVWHLAAAVGLLLAVAYLESEEVATP